MSRYVSGAVLVDGVAAHVLARMLASEMMRAAQSGFPGWMRLELDATWSAIRRAAREYEQRALAAEGTAETAIPEVAPRSGDEITTAEAAALLGVSARRVRQLAAGGMGEKRHGRWILHREVVLVALAHRRSSE